jgi:uncharacterized radical SAM superfamily Fe-S cluster-containing enzyme
MTIKQYNGQEATFYIQCKGLHSGRPLKKPIPNCFAVFTDIPNAFELAYAVFTARKYEIYIKGSVIPFIRLSDAKEVLSKFANKSTYRIESNLKQIELIDKQIINLKKQIENLEHLKKYNAKVICNI